LLNELHHYIHLEHAQTFHFIFVRRNCHDVSLIQDRLVNTEASLDLALAAYKRGEYKVAEQMLLPLANGGDSTAQYHLGLMYRHGRGVKQDEVEAAKWYRLAAEQGRPTAQFALGLAYQSGRGVNQDYAEAAKWLQKAAEQGRAAAQAALGLMHRFGRGVPQDDDEAAKWYRKAATQGSATGQFALGLMYRQGRGVPRDYGVAAKWFRSAADQGHIAAMGYLGLMYFQGSGVQKDLVEAYKWSTLASRTEAKASDLARRSCEMLAKEMTADQINQAHKLVHEWLPKTSLTNE
jgi:uncharacterized protein